LEQGAEFVQEIELREQTMGFVRIKLHDRNLPLSNATILIAKKNHEEGGKSILFWDFPNILAAIIREKEPGSGVFEFLVNPGHYILSINKIGYPQRQEDIEVKKGENDFKIELRQQLDYGSPKNSNSNTNQTSFSTHPRPQSGNKRYHSGNIQSQEFQRTEKGNVNFSDPKAQPVDNTATIKKTEEDKKPDRVKSALVKKVEISVWNVDNNKPITGATIMVEEIGFKANTNEEGKLLLPVNKLTNGNIIVNHDQYFGIVEEYGSQGIDFKNINEKRFFLIPKPHDANEIQVRFIPGNKKACLTLQALYESNNNLVSSLND